MIPQSHRFVSAVLVCMCALSSALHAAPPAAPSDLQVSIPRSNALDASWVDNSSDETGFRLEVRIPPEAGWTGIFVYATDVTTASLNGGVPGVSYEFRVVAINDDGETPSPIASVTVPNVLTSPPYAHIAIGEPFSYSTETSNAGESASRTYAASPLPDGLAIDPDSGVISGTPTVDGYFDTVISVSFDDPPSPTIEGRLALRIPPVPGPPVVTPFPAVTLPSLAPAGTIALGEHFEDPDTRDAVTIATSAGDMVFSLFHRAAPVPVENFLNYVDRGDYSSSVFHRSVNAATFDIIQSGGFVGDAMGISSVTTDPPIVNAPGIPNDRGTLAYARTSNPDSATSGWYINTVDSPGLDVGDSYTVFGRITAATLPVMDAIFAFPTGTHSIDVNGFNQSFNDFPTTDGDAPTNGPPPNLITVEGITRIPALVFAVDSNSAPSVASAQVMDVEGVAQLEILPLSPGTTDLVISATDIDGNTVTAPLAIQVEENYASWAAANGAGAPTDRSDAGSLTDLQEYGLGGDPITATDDISLLPTATTVEIEGVLYDAVTFRHRTNAGDLRYAVEASEDLEGWTTVWQTSDGFGDDAVVSSTDDGDFKVLTVRLPNTREGTDSIYLRSVISLSADG